MCQRRVQMTAQQKYLGSCLCGGIRYEIHGEIGDIIQCHCQRCRKSNGTAFATNAPVKIADFHFVSGEHLLKKFQSTPTTQRCFCSQCGSLILSIKQDTPEHYRLRIGTLDTVIPNRPSMHIFVADKAEWDQICDDVPQYPQRP